MEHKKPQPSTLYKFNNNNLNHKGEEESHMRGSQDMVESWVHYLGAPRRENQSHTEFNFNTKGWNNMQVDRTSMEQIVNPRIKTIGVDNMLQVGSSMHMRIRHTQALISTLSIAPDPGSQGRREDFDGLYSFLK